MLLARDLLTIYGVEALAVYADIGKETVVLMKKTAAASNLILHSHREKRHERRPTIGLLTSEEYTVRAPAHWMGAVEAARAYDVNLLCFPGVPFHAPHDFTEQVTVIFDLIDPTHLDGLVLWTSSLNWYIGQDVMTAFCRQYQLPMVSVAVALDGIPSILIPHYQGIYDVMTHFIEEHGYRRIAFFKGHPGHLGARERYRGYVAALADHGLPLEPDLVTPPHERWDGRAAIRVLLDERRLRPGVDFEVIVGASTGMVWEALEILQARDIHVPGEVALAGFDDSPEFVVSTPPITTITAGLSSIGRQAVEVLLAQLRGEPVPERTVVPLQLRLRQSCGCRDPLVAHAVANSGGAAGESFDAAIAARRDRILSAMGRSVEDSENVVAWTQQLFDGFVDAMQGKTPEHFLTSAEQVLRQIVSAGGDVNAWQEALSALRREVLAVAMGKLDPSLRDRAENLWQQARLMFAERTQRVEATHALQERQWIESLNRIGARLIMSFDVVNLMEVLKEELPQLNIPSCYLSLYTNPKTPLDTLRLVLAYKDGASVDLISGGQSFPSRHLVPPEFLPQGRAYSLMVAPLHFQEEQIGLALFEIGPQEGRIYQLLRKQISSALQGALLVQHVQAYAHDLEGLVEDRTAEVRRINALMRNEIVERKKTEQALRVNEQQYRMLAENVKNGVLIVQAETIIFVNEVFAQTIGDSVERLCQRNLLALFPDHAKHDIREHILPDNPNEAGPPWQVELLTSDGRTIWTEIEQSSIVWNMHPATLLTIRNINQSKLREMRLEEERARLRQENVLFKSTIKDRFRFGALIGKSAAMQRVYELIVSAASSDVNVLIYGESGTGKELIARTIHQVSRRKAHAFVPVNCASIPETLFEREFFGHRKGAFTSADQDRPGHFDRARQGVLFLDEVTELAPGTQAKLLRVLQDGEYTPLGSNTPKQANALIVAATNKDPRTEIEAGRLRKDFFYRICIIEIPVPTLRERKEDLPLLIEHLLDQYRRSHAAMRGDVSTGRPGDRTTLPGELVQALYDYTWPGNVRELQNILQRYLATSDFPAVLRLINAPERILAMSELTAAAGGIQLPEVMKDVEKRVILETLAKNRNHRQKTADMLGITRRSLQHRLKKLGLLDERDSVTSKDPS